jgi:hypothetical protein
MGIRHGGRKRGTPNKRTQELSEKLAELGCDPAAGLAAIADDPKTPIELRVSCYKELATYLYPKRKAVDLAHDGPPIILHFGAEDALL